MIKKLWVKFNGMDIECVCEDHDRKCRDGHCGEYIVKFIEVKRNCLRDITEKDFSKEQKAINNLTREIKKFDSELKKSIRKFKI